MATFSPVVRPPLFWLGRGPITPPGPAMVDNGPKGPKFKQKKKQINEENLNVMNENEENEKKNVYQTIFFPLYIRSQLEHYFAILLSQSR